MEIGFPPIGGRPNRAGDLVEPHRIKRDRLLTGWVVQLHTVLQRAACCRSIGDGLFVIHLRTFLPTDLGKAELRQGEGLTHPQFRHPARPGRAVDDCQRLVDATGAAAVRLRIDISKIKILAAAIGVAEEG